MLMRLLEETTAKDTNQTIDMRADPSIIAVFVNAEHNDDIDLRPEQRRLLDIFRQILLSCEIDPDRFQACADL